MRIVPIVVASALLCAAATAAKRPLTADTIWDFRAVGDPQITKDGARVIYTLTWADKMTDAFYTNLWIASIIDQSGKTDERPLTTGAFRDTSPRLSYDNSRLAYISNRSGHAQIRVRWLDSGQEAQITDLEQTPSAIEWSPDGKWISYIARVPAKPEWSVKMPEKPAGAVWAPPAIAITRLRWKADGAGITPPGYRHVFIVPATGGTPRQITSGDYDHTSAAWSPKGDWIYASAQRSPDAEYELDGGEIYAFSLKDGEVRKLTDRKGPDTNPVPSPGGTRIAYLGHDWKFQSYSINHLYVMHTDGSQPKCLTCGFDRDVRSPVWSWDGKTIYFLADDRGGAQLYSVPGDGGAVTSVTSGKHRLGSAYATADPLVISETLTVATTRSTPTEPSAIVVFNVKRPDRIIQVTDVNGSLLADRQLGAVEDISYDSFDGKPIQGWIIKPPNFDPARKYPLLLEIHGGPHAMYGVEFQHEMQIHAARGFVVLYTNPRGSTGYGEDFGNIIHTKYPGDDYKDLMAGVDMVIAKGYIDPKRLTLTGGSGGGLLTAWVIGHTDRFAAAVAQYPVTNWITQAGTADGGYTHSALWMKSMPWDNPKQYIDHSPIFFAKNFKTPTMVLTGEADLRTPIAESEELYFALKAMKVPAVMIRIPDEPHGIRGAHPSHRIAKIENILAWMEKYTQ
jgi:dipeptidyl aminopeptidase/acylaminoacyl peptidase